MPRYCRKKKKTSLSNMGASDSMWLNDITVSFPFSLDVERRRFLLQSTVVSLRLSTLEREPFCAGSGNPCDGNQCCAGCPFSNSLTFPCPNADEGFVGCQSEPVKCPGSCDWCSGGQCRPGFADSNNLTFPCPTASASYNMCQSATRFTDSSACDAITSAIGDPHVTSVTGEKFDLWKTGWSTFVQIPKDVQPNSVPKFVVTGKCLALWQRQVCSFFPAEREDDGFDDGR